MAEFGAGPEFAAQCPQVPAPDGWRPWVDADGPIPEAVTKRSKALVDEALVPLGTTESYPLPGVTALIRVEPHKWGRDASGALIQGCFRAASIYLPSRSPAVETITSPGIGTTTKLIGGLTVVSLTVGIIATVASFKKRRAAA